MKIRKGKVKSLLRDKMIISYIDKYMDERLPSRNYNFPNNTETDSARTLELFKEWLLKTN